MEQNPSNPEDKDNEKNISDQEPSKESTSNEENRRKEIHELKKKYKSKNSTCNGILSIIASILHKIGLGTVFVLTNFSTYLISYLRHYQPEDSKSLTLQHTYFIGPVFSVTMGIFMPFCGVLEFKLGIKCAIILGSILNIAGSALLYISHNYYLDLVAFFLFAIGNSISIVLTGKNAVMYFFEKKGAISGALSLISTLLGSVFNVIGEKIIINPESTDPDSENFYPFEVSKNLLKYYLFQIAIIAVTTILTVIIIVPFDMSAMKKLSGKIKEHKEEKLKEKEKSETLLELNQQSNIEINEQKEEKLLPDMDNENNENLVIDSEKKNPDEAVDAEIDDMDILNIERKKNLDNEPINQPIMNDLSITIPQKNYSTYHIRTAAKSFRVWRFFLMSICSGPLSNLMTMTWRPIGIYNHLPTKGLQYISTYSAIVMSISTPLFGFLSDKVPYRVIQVTLSLISSLIGFLFYFSFHNITLFTILVLGNSFCKMGGYAITAPHFMKVFGMKYYVEIAGVIGLAGVFMGPICSFFAYFIENSDLNKDLTYRIMFTAGAGLNVVEGILAAFETEDPFGY